MVYRYACKVDEIPDSSGIVERMGSLTVEYLDDVAWEKRMCSLGRYWIREIVRIHLR
jgi:hypothetical protein